MKRHSPPSALLAGNGVSHRVPWKQGILALAKLFTAGRPRIAWGVSRPA